MSKSITLGVIVGFFILFFMPESKMSFNWHSAQAAWQFYQEHKKSTEAEEKIEPLTIDNLSFSSAVQKAYPSVISIYAYRPKGIRDNYQTDDNVRILDVGVGFGSGIILENGYLVTNYHVIANAKNVSFNLSDGRRRYADLVGYDIKTDIAVLKTDIQDLKPAKLANSSEVRVGDLVMAIGSPFGSNQSVSLGIISAVMHDPYARIQTDAAINNGNSGGPLINSSGEIIGINRSSVNSKGGGQTGVNYAIPIDKVKHIVNDIILYGRARRNWLGISAAELLDDDYKKYFPNIEQGRGIFVTEIDPSSPAHRADIKPKDLLISYDKQEINGVSEFYKMFYNTPIGKSVEFELIRFHSGKKMKIVVQLEEEINTALN
ncbi:S1C family serine protease [Aliikangiella sp. IMCC44359]|uniref:S1C family serine protease n=1 Tax=Aliikangiella sp. IMCC44359 TaxID=3459125 RepID=UPI00403AA220